MRNLAATRGTPGCHWGCCWAASPSVRGMPLRIARDCSQRLVPRAHRRVRDGLFRRCWTLPTSARIFALGSSPRFRQAALRSTKRASLRPQLLGLLHPRHPRIGSLYLRERGLRPGMSCDGGVATATTKSTPRSCLPAPRRPSSLSCKSRVCAAGTRPRRQRSIQPARPRVSATCVGSIPLGLPRPTHSLPAVAMATGSPRCRQHRCHRRRSGRRWPIAWRVRFRAPAAHIRNASPASHATRARRGFEAVARTRASAPEIESASW